MTYDNTKHKCIPVATDGFINMDNYTYIDETICDEVTENFTNYKEGLESLNKENLKQLFSFSLFFFWF